MASRYCKSIPTEIYFIKESNGSYGGPYIHPPKGKDQLIICKIQNISVKSNPKKTVTVDKPSLSTELPRIEKWLKSDNGKETMKENERN